MSLECLGITVRRPVGSDQKARTDVGCVTRGPALQEHLRLEDEPASLHLNDQILVLQTPKRLGRGVFPVPAATARV